MWIKTLKIQQFRNIEAATVEVPAGGAYAVVGPNGAGKTSLLEALSMLTPGRGLHRAKLEEITRHNQPSWGVFARIRSGGEDHTLGMQFDRKKRQIKLDGQPLTSAAPLAALGSVVWFTPEMDRLFFDGPAPRRRFFDRLVFGLLPDHAEHLTRYTHHIQNRARLLKDSGDADWIAIEEKQAARWGVQVLAARQTYLAALSPLLADVSLSLHGSAEKGESLPDEATFTTALLDNRSRDKRFNSTHYGPHRTEVTGALTDTDAAISLTEASMGQHKRALMHIIIAHCRLIKDRTGQAPCLLLDEATAHLDQTNRARLFNQIQSLGSQLWLTGTEENMFEGLEKVSFLRTEKGHFTWA
ncbi:MAG: DNA replication and repair protein RecF [Proteobacteria bacterium]|nr:DNA replication and repair protein RecF [Pseudomonadota bacterium]